MKLRSFQRSWALRALLSTLLWSSPTVAKSEKPAITATKFDNSPYDLRYFDDSDVVLMQDYAEDAIFRSSDAGATWARAADIPKGAAWNLIMHPFDNKKHAPCDRHRAWTIDVSKQYRRLDAERAVPLDAAELAEGVTVWWSTGMPNHALLFLYT